MKSKLLYLSFVISVLFLNYSNAQQTYVPDDVLEQYLIDQGYDTVLDDYVLTNNIINITEIDLGAKGVSDLTGIEDFTALVTLDISENTLLNSVNINSNTALINLNAWNTSISNINLSNNTALEYLNIYNTLISNIDVSNNTSLDYISIASTSISELDISNNTLLNYLNVSQTNLSNLNVTNSAALDFLLANNTPNLACITVIDEIAATAGTGIYEDWEKDETTYYSESCSLSNSDFNITDIYVGPNPIKDELQILLNNNDVLKEVSLFDISGKQIIKSTNTTVFTNHLASGIYLVKITTNRGEFNLKLVKS